MEISIDEPIDAILTVTSNALVITDTTTTESGEWDDERIPFSDIDVIECDQLAERSYSPLILRLFGIFGVLLTFPHIYSIYLVVEQFHLAHLIVPLSLLAISLYVVKFSYDLNSKIIVQRLLIHESGVEDEREFTRQADVDGDGIHNPFSDVVDTVRSGGLK